MPDAKSPVSPLLTVMEATEILRISRNTAYAMTKSGSLTEMAAEALAS